jgi:DNA-binding MarR family transcriptional regulator
VTATGATGRGHFVRLAESAGPSESLALLHFGFRAVVKGPDQLLARRGLGRVHHRILFFIARFPGCTVSELFATLGVTKQALHGPLQALARARLVVARPEPTNRRLRRLTLTAAGRALEERLSGAQRELFAAVFRRVGPAAAAGWRDVMRALSDRL